MPVQCCNVCDTDQLFEAFQASNGRLKLHKVCTTCRMSKRDRKGILKRKKASTDASQHYYAHRKTILEQKRLQYEEEKAWRLLFGEDAFEIGENRIPKYFKPGKKRNIVKK